MENAVKSRGIKYIWHFTRLENIDSILTNGIVPRSTLEDRLSNVIYNDSYRFDNHKNASCFSITHPNYKMFYSLRKQNEMQEWVVIGCAPDILWIKDCAFCYENAASSTMTNIPLEMKKGVVAFESLFYEADGKPSREELRLKDNCPTNPQAEVLIFDLVEPKYIIGAVCISKNRADSLKAIYPNFDFIYHRTLFSARSDYEHWR